MSVSDTINDVSAPEFRQAMRHLAGGVSVITVGKGKDISGLTVTSVSSLSVDPATVIVSVNRQSSSWGLLQEHGIFGVNILSADQADVAERFSGRDGLKGIERFEGARWTRGVTGVPLLLGSLAALDCDVEEIIERHSHGIVIGRVRDIIAAQHGGGLAYWQSDYIAIDRNDDAIRLAQISLPLAQV